MGRLRKMIGRKKGGAEIATSEPSPRPLPKVAIDPKRTDGRYHYVFSGSVKVGRLLYRYVPGRFVFIGYIETDKEHQRQGYGTSVLAQLATKHNAVIVPVKENSTGFWRALLAKSDLPFILGEECDEAFVSGMKTYRSDEEPDAKTDA